MNVPQATVWTYVIVLICQRCATPFGTDKEVLKTRGKLGQPISCPRGHRHTISWTEKEWKLELRPKAAEK